jgi:dihydroxy-acid dehydratase
MGVTGRILSDNLAGVADYPATQDIIRSFSNPLKKDSQLIVLYGNLAPAGAVAKISGQEGPSCTGRARTYNDEQAETAAILAGKVGAGDAVVIRYAGPPKVAPACATHSVPPEQSSAAGLRTK